MCLKGLKHIILVGSKMPVAFFAYPNKPSLLSPEDCQGHVLCKLDEDPIGALEALAEAVGASRTPAPVVDEAEAGARAPARSSRWRSARSLGALLPENAIVVDEAVTTGPRLLRADQGGGAA